MRNISFAFFKCLSIRVNTFCLDFKYFFKRERGHSLILLINFFQKLFFKEGIITNTNNSKFEDITSYAKSLPSLLACTTTKEEKKKIKLVTIQSRVFKFI